MPEKKELLELARTSQWSKLKSFVKKESLGYDWYEYAESTGPERGMSVLWYFAKSSLMKDIKRVMDMGATDFNAAPIQINHEYEGVTVFWLVTFSKDYLIIKRILEHCTISQIDTFPKHERHPEKGITPLWLLCEQQKWELVDLLIQKGVKSFDVGPANPIHPKYGITPFWMAVYDEQWDIVKLMLYNGASLFDAHKYNNKTLEDRNVIEMLLSKHQVKLIFDSQSSGHFINQSPEVKASVDKALQPLHNAFQSACETGLYRQEYEPVPTGYYKLPQTFRNQFAIAYLRGNFSVLFQGWSDSELQKALEDYYQLQYLPNRCEKEVNIIISKLMQDLKDNSGLDSSAPLLFNPQFVKYKKQQIKKLILDKQSKNILPQFLSNTMRTTMVEQLKTSDLSKPSLEEHIQTASEMFLLEHITTLLSTFPIEEDTDSPIKSPKSTRTVRL